MAISMAGILAVLIALTPTSMANAYTCSSTSSTHNVNTQSGVSGSSGGCASSSSAISTSGPNGSAQATANGPPTASGQLDGCITATKCNSSTSGQTASGAIAMKITPPFKQVTIASANGPGQGFVSGTVSGNSGNLQSISSSSAGGSQSSCSSSSGSAVSGSTSSTSTSQPGSCP
jgi:hypothetical protein